MVRLHQSNIHGLCISILRDVAKSQDAAQEVFVKAYLSLRHFRREAQFGTWLYRIAYRHCIDLIRKEKRERAESWEALLEQAGDRIERLLNSEPSPEDILERQELVTKGLAALKMDYRNVLLLREEQGLSYEQIASVMECSIDSVKARLKRARADLADKLRHLSGPGSVPKP